LSNTGEQREAQVKGGVYGKSRIEQRWEEFCRLKGRIGQCRESSNDLRERLRSVLSNVRSKRLGK